MESTKRLLIISVIFIIIIIIIIIIIKTIIKNTTFTIIEVYLSITTIMEDSRTHL